MKPTEPEKKPDKSVDKYSNRQQTVGISQGVESTGKSPVQCIITAGEISERIARPIGNGRTRRKARATKTVNNEITAERLSQLQTRE
jgi:hypothetical protein